MELLLSANVRQGVLVIHKHYKLIYYIDEDTIYIAALIDTRADPDSLAEKMG